MAEELITKSEIDIQAPAYRVWEALIKPEMIKEYLFGTDVKTDWKVGSPIKYTGEWEGKKYEDKGEIMTFEPGKKLVTTYWSSMSGVEDKPENYKTVTYELSQKGAITKLSITQTNNKNQEEADHTKQNWDKVLRKIKKILES